MADKYAIIIIEDHPLVREGLASYFAGTGRWDVKGTAATLAEAKELARRTEADLVLIDMQLEDGWGLDIIPCLKGKTLAAVYSAFDDYSHVSTAMGMGAKAYICKRQNSQELEKALLKVLKGETYIDDTVQAKFQAVTGRINLLTKREREVFNLAKSKLPNKQIAAQLGISVRRVENILYTIYDKIGVRSRYELEML
ncbi:MAG: response regulator transcription factor [Treponema sp.]|nr:response regulator transcription factor [Treponema sp.]